MTTTAAAYIRKSNDQQDRTEDVKSVATQRDLIAAFAASRGWTVDEKYVFADDGITGALFAERPGLQALLAATRATPVPFTKLIVVEQSRLGRDQIDTMVLIRDIEEAGIEIWSTRDGRRITLSDDTSKLLASLEGWRDESERKKTATRVRDAAKTRFERGYVVGGRVYGYKNERLPGVKGAARLVVNEDQAQIVRRMFRMAADGFGLSRLAQQLNAEGVPGPQRLSDAEVERMLVEGKPVPVNQWSISGVREVLHRDLYRGVVTFGKVRRTGPKTRVKLPKDQWQTRPDESLRIVDPELWAAAHARIAATVNTFLRAADGSGRMVGHAEAIVNRYLLSGLLACGAHSDAPGRKPFCGSPLIATTRGRKRVPSYVCAGYREKGKTFCTNQTGVPMAELHRAVIDSLKVTFSDEKFEQYLRDQAADTEQIAARRAERENLLLQIPKLAAAEAKLAKAIAVSDDMDALVAELKATQQERRQAEARVADLEGYERDLRHQQEQVERLRQVWGGWAAALDADVPTARQILKKILVGRIYVRPVGPGAWRFAGISRYDGALRGGLGRTAPADVQPGYGPRNDDVCRLMLHLLAEPKSVAEAPDPSRRESLFGLCSERRPIRVIAGGSDAEVWDQTGGVSSGPPCTSRQAAKVLGEALEIFVGQVHEIERVPFAVDADQ
jgi:site-specific DNA recombinase